MLAYIKWNLICKCDHGQVEVFKTMVTDANHQNRGHVYSTASKCSDIGLPNVLAPMTMNMPKSDRYKSLKPTGILRKHNVRIPNCKADLTLKVY